MYLIAAALVAVAAPAAPQQPVGLYEIDQMEMAGGLQLGADGRFHYALDYGAVSEEAAGTWTAVAGAVILTTDPMPPKAECDRGFASACFNRTRLERDGDRLILYRWDAWIVLKPVQPRPR
jgi:hypothetical protein